MRLFASLLVLLTLCACNTSRPWVPSPPQIAESPVRAADRVYLLTRQIENRFGYSLDESNPRVLETAISTDIWAFDAATATPVWRKRLKRITSKASFGAQIGSSLLGVEAGTIWALLPSGLFAVSAASGDILAQPETIEAKNSDLKGVLPKEHAYYRLDAAGLHIRAADGREWRLLPSDFTVSAPGSAAVGGVSVAAGMVPNMTRVYQARGLEIPGRWLGLLTPAEAAALAAGKEIPDMDMQSRRRLWGAQVKQDNNVFRPRQIFSELTPLGEEFLAPGLLSLRGRPLLARNPDSVLILHQDRLGEDRRLQLTRVAGPAGNAIWKTPLPLSVLQSVLPGEGSLGLFGVLFVPPGKNGRRDPLQTAHQILTTVDMAAGTAHTFYLSDVDHLPEAVPAAQSSNVSRP